MIWPRALVFLLALTACTSGGTPRSAPSTPAPSSSASVALPTPKPTMVDESYPPETPYRPLPASMPLSGFEPASVSFVSTRTGWFLGRQQCGSGSCGVLLQTRDAGRTFHRLVAPPMEVSDVRFADLQEGWAFGNGRFDTRDNPGLWRTHDGGQHWKKVLPNPVSSLEVGDGTVWAIVLHEDGTGPSLFRGSARANTVRLVAQIPNRAAVVTVGHGTAYVVAQEIAGPIDTTLLVANGSGLVQRRNPCQHSQRGRMLQIAVGRARHLAAVCSGEGGTGEQPKDVYASTDDGRTWRRRPDPPQWGYTGGGVAATSTRTFLTGGRNAINMEIGSGPWQQVLDSEGGAGFSFIGMTDESHGVALESLGGAWLTANSGETWRRVHFV